MVQQFIIAYALCFVAYTIEAIIKGIKDEEERKQAAKFKSVVLICPLRPPVRTIIPPKKYNFKDYKPRNSLESSALSCAAKTRALQKN